VSEKTGLHPDDQKILFKDKERSLKAFLDTAGVKDRSKLTLLDDPEARTRRLLELRRTEKSDKASKSISCISLEVDRLATKVCGFFFYFFGVFSMQWKHKNPASLILTLVLFIFLLL
jgi:hypothetical protein